MVPICIAIIYYVFYYEKAKKPIEEGRAGALAHKT
jgi:hypothetical protein